MKALREAEKAFNEKEVPIGAIIIRNGKIIGRGHNQCEGLNDPTAHAEIIAISSATNTLKDWRLSECSLYVTKEPCPMCAGAIINSRLKFVGFGAYDEKKGSLESVTKIYNKKHFFVPEIYGGINEHECSRILKNFFKDKRQQ